MVSSEWDTGDDAGARQVLITVPTFRRVAWAAELLDALGEQLASVPAARVLILDNDPDASAGRLAQHPLVRSGEAEVEYVGAGDVVSVRNVALQRARERGVGALVMLDDDLMPRPGWLAALVHAAGEHEAQVVAGPVLQDEAVLRTPHAAALLLRDQRRAGPFRGDVSTANVLLTADLLRLPSLHFNPALGSSGGEDTLFFRQAASAGASLWWVSEAVVVERVASARLTRRALLLRSYRNGRSSVVVDRLHGSASGRWARLAVLVGAAVVYLPHAATQLMRGDRVGAWRSFYKLVRHLGRCLPRVAERTGVGGGGYGG